jgi:hypothetical protein
MRAMSHSANDTTLFAIPPGPYDADVLRSVCSSAEDVSSERGQRLWELWRHGTRIEAQLHDRGFRNVELRVVGDDVVIRGQVYGSVEHAMNDAWKWRRGLEVDGWASPYAAPRPPR